MGITIKSDLSLPLRYCLMQGVLKSELAKFNLDNFLK